MQSSKPLRLSLNFKGVAQALFLIVVLGLLIYFINVQINQSNLAKEYAGWRVYCDNAGHICFKYPHNWRALSTNSKRQAGYEVLSRSDSVNVDYTNPSFNDVVAAIGNVYTESLGNISSDSQVTIVGVVARSVPYYVIINKTEVKTFNLQVGKTTTGDPDLNHYNFNGNVELLAYPTKRFTNNQSAISWYKSSDAQTSLHIMQSLYFNFSK